MVHTIRVTKKGDQDSKGQDLLAQIKRTLNIHSITKIRTTKVYRLEGISKTDLKKFTRKVLYEEIDQKVSYNGSITKDANQTIEIAYKPGVMNPEVGSLLKAAGDLGIKLTAADSSWEYGFFGKITRVEAKDLITKLRLYNPLIEHILDQKPKTLLIIGKVGKTQILPIRNMTDVELMNLSRDKLFLNLEEMKVIQNYFKKIKREPTDCEIETLAQTWSEHSGHKTFKAKIMIDGKEKEPFIERLKKEALKHKKNIVSAFVDNAGVMDFYDGWAINGKGETHNSPSAIEPYGGAMTGSGGVFRDIVATGQGAKTVISTDIFCLANWDMNPKKLPKGSLPPRYILSRVVSAVRDYGNRMGIPTNNGSFHFHDDFRAKPTVLVGAYGILPKKYAKKGVVQKGDVVVSIGGRIGRDGIHGATFSSGEMTQRTITTNAQAVQIGNAIEEKRTFDAIIEARDQDCIRAMQDSGGGGLSSAIGEMGAEIGVSVQLKNERLKYQGLNPWEIWLSESQERMVLAIPKNKIKKFVQICKKYNVEISTLGVFDDSKKLKVFYGSEKVCDLEMQFLHKGLPQRVMKAKEVTKSKSKENKSPNIPKTQTEWIKTLQNVLSDGNICSKEPVLRMYDHTVQGTSVLQPYTGESCEGPNDAAVIRPILGKPYGIVVSHGLNPILNRIDPYWGSIWAATEAISNYVAVGGIYQDASLVNNYIWPFPDEESLGSLDRSITAVVDFMKTLKIPVISGKDSLSSTYRSDDNFVLKIPPVLCISAFGKIPDVKKTVSSDFKKTGSTIVQVGKPDMLSMGGSVYFSKNNLLGQSVPRVDLKILPKVLDVINQGISNGQIISCHDVSEGGIITAIFEMCLGGTVGAKINGDKKVRPDYFLFNETAGCFIVEVKSKKQVQKLFKNVPYKIIGETIKKQDLSFENLFSVNIGKLKISWQKPMKEIFK
ncbi:MAG: phosphoribosylformylglycinamidine synthase subunit PurL [Candidatus Curtissbacteria bacterium]|nr:phosphoribosylformylglycinamidine synthase subunit PurL [Candidatus Curtissbacteria bacterium]